KHAERRRRARIAARDAPRVEERRVAEAEQAPRIPLGVEALLDAEQHAILAGLITDRIAAQAVVAAEQHLRVGVELVRGERAEGHRQQAIVQVAPVVARVELRDRVLEAVVLVARRGARAELKQLTGAAGL